YYQGADLFCLPSYSENFGLAVLEACQVGTRVLTTNQTPWSALGEWNAGFIVEPTVTDIQQGLLTFFSSAPWPAEHRSELAQRVRQRFGWESIGPQYLQLYKAVLEGQTIRHDSQMAGVN